MIEIGAERTARDGGFEVLVRRGDQPDIDRNFAAAAHGTDAPLLQGAEQLHLRFIGQVADLVQKERAAVRGFEGARLVAHGSRKRTLDVAEKLRSGQFARNGAAVHGHERLPGTPAFAVNQLGHMLLARAAGAGHQHRHVGRRNEPDIFVKPLRGIAAALDVIGTLLPRFLRRSGGNGRLLTAGSRDVERFADLFQQFVGIDRLGHVIPRAQLHAAHGVLYLGVARHHDHRNLHMLPGHPLQQGDAVLVGQAHIAQHERESALRERRTGRRDARRRLGPEALFREPRLEHQGEGDIVVYD